LTTSEFPNSWKLAKVLPIPKSGNELRPICILPVLSKAFEKILSAQITHYIENNSLISKFQSGFRPRHSCVTALIHVTEEIRSAIDSNKVTFLGLLDFSKAFLNVEHIIMISKLEHKYNFSQSALNLMKLYLSNRQQAVDHGGKTSSFIEIKKGVPQGSILGPLLFAMYIDDLPQQLNLAKVHLYADDVQIYLSCDKTVINNCAIQFNLELSAIKQWADKNGLTLNPSKCKCLVISKRPVDMESVPDILIGNDKIELVQSAKNLGVIFNSSLSFDNHIRATLGKVYGMLRCLWASQSFTPQHIRLLLAKTYLIPVLLYGCELFANMDSTHKQKMNVLYNNIARYIFDRKRFDSISTYAKQISGMSFSNLLDFKSLIALQKIISTGQPPYLH